MGFLKYFLSEQTCDMINDGRQYCIFLIQDEFIIDTACHKQYTMPILTDAPCVKACLLRVKKIHP
jgi:hypothetical protein